MTFGFDYSKLTLADILEIQLFLVAPDANPIAQSVALLQMIEKTADLNELAAVDYLIITQGFIEDLTELIIVGQGQQEALAEATAIINGGGDE